MGRPSRYPDEFRYEAVQMALASDESRASVARRLGVNDTVDVPAHDRIRGAFTELAHCLSPPVSRRSWPATAIRSNNQQRPCGTLTSTSKGNRPGHLHERVHSLGDMSGNW